MGAAIPIAALALSAVGTIGSLSQGSGGSGAKTAAVSLEHLAYLKDNQKKKELLSQQMIEDAKKFSSVSYDNEINYLNNTRALQEQQLLQQAATLRSNFLQQQQGLIDERFLNTITDSTEDFGQRLALSQANFSRGLEEVTTKAQYQTNEAARAFEEAQAGVQEDFARRGQDAERLINQSQFGVTQSGRDLEKLNQQQELKTGREDALLQHLRGKDQLRTDETLNRISREGLIQSADTQKMSLELQQAQQLMGLKEQQESQERGVPIKTSRLSSSDNLAKYATSGIEDLMQAHQQQTINNVHNIGSLDNQLRLALTSNDANSLQLQQQGLSLDTQLRLDNLSRTQQLASGNLTRGLGSMSDQLQTLMLPELSRQLSLQQQQAQRAGTNLQLGVSRNTEQDSLRRQSLTNEYSNLTDTATFDLNERNRGLARGYRDSDQRQRNLQQQGVYQQGLNDIAFGGQLLDQSFDLGRDTAEQSRYSTQQNLDIQALQQIANQKSALQAAMSQIQAGLLGNSSGAGIGDIASALGGLLEQGSTVFANQQNVANQNRLLNPPVNSSNFAIPNFAINGFGRQQTPTARFAAPAPAAASAPQRSSAPHSLPSRAAQTGVFTNTFRTQTR